jgi:hypothetical protein
VIVGGWFTDTYRVSVAVIVPLLTSRVKPALVALLAATIFAVTVPAVLTIFEIATPFDGFALVTLTVRLPAATSTSVTVAIAELLTALPAILVIPLAVVIVGGWFTVTFRVAVAVPVPSLTSSVKVAPVAPLAATIFAVTVPAELVISEIVTPFDGLALVTVTVRLPAGVSASVTVAIVERLTARPAILVTSLAAVIVGGWFTVTLSVAVAVAVSSLTCSVKVALVAPVAATISAVIVPVILAIFEIVTPFDGLALVTVTVRLPAEVSASVTDAIVERLTVRPAVLVTPPAAVIVGGWFTVTFSVAVAVAVPSLTSSVKVALVALLAATIFAVTVPAALAIFEMVTPFDVVALVTVTVRLPADVSVSVTVAIVELLTELPAVLVTPLAAVIVGGWFTVTFRVAVVVPVPSLTWSVKVALVAPLTATISAVTVPAVLAIFEIVTPFDVVALVTVTVRLPADVSVSVTVAIVELLTPLPAVLVTPLAAVIVGGWFTVTFRVAVVVPVPSLTWSVKVALVAPLTATISAVTVPAVLAIFEIVTPFDGLALVTVTVRLPADVSASVTVAIVERLTARPAILVIPLAVVIVGGWFTVTFRVAVAVPVPSLTWSVKVALVALLAATIFAVTVPAALAIFEIVTPFDGLALVTVTVRLPADVSASVTVAMVELLAELPAVLTTPLAVVIVGVMFFGK